MTLQSRLVASLPYTEGDSRVRCNKYSTRDLTMINHLTPEINLQADQSNSFRESYNVAKAIPPSA
jgi:hypothetical protein